jgi:serine/threonine protein kinase
MEGKVVTYVNEHGETKILRNISKIGEGSFGIVYKALLDGFGEVAVKYMRKIDEGDIKAAILQYKKGPELEKHSLVLRKIVTSPATRDAFPELLNVEYVSVTHSDIKKNKILFIYDLAVGMDLFDVIETKLRSGVPFTLRVLKQYISQLLEGIIEIRNAGVIHRDIKVENIMLHSGKLKYIDYGMICEPVGENKCQGMMGTPSFISPKIIKAFQERREPSEKDWYDGDLYALGITFVNLICQVTPFHDKPKSAEDVFAANTIEGSYNEVKAEIEDILMTQNQMNFFPLINGLTQENPITPEAALAMIPSINKA